MPHITIKGISKENTSKMWETSKNQLMEICELPEARFLVDHLDHNPISKDYPIEIMVSWIDRGNSKQDFVNAITDACNKVSDKQVRVEFLNKAKESFFINKEMK